MFHRTASGRQLAFERLEGQGPGVVFLHGFKSDMGGTKAVDLEAWCREQGRAMLRFDLSGHGGSGGRVEEFGIADWLEDARDVIDALAPGPQVLVGSSLGGWLALLLARARPERWAGLVTIAAAPDFTQQGFWAGFNDAQRDTLMRAGRVELPSDYSDQPYVITRRLIEDGRDHLVMNQPLRLPFPVRMLQGTADEDVPADWAVRLLDHATGDDIRLTLVKGADHRFSTPECLQLIAASIDDVLA